mmetsp:Transcript_29136/g.63837  ORF Transcript_29136/g.63837 Transcript_29136/m.63837 type:complete len:282 (-) Transcript_29136:400-1245(-)
MCSLPSACESRWFRIADFQRLSLKLIADGLLRGNSAYAHEPFDPLAKWLVFPGELSIEKLTLGLSLALHFSSFNPGAREVAEELMARLTWLELIDVEKTTPACIAREARNVPSQLRSANDAVSASTGPLLLYLNKVTFAGEDGVQLAQTVRAARAAGMRLVLFHENDEALGGGPFHWHFSTTPQDLISDGLFDDLAIEFVPMPHREVSLALAARTISTDLPAKQKRFWGIDSAKSWFSWTRKKREVQSTSREENLAPISDATNQGASALDGGNPERKSETI